MERGMTSQIEQLQKQNKQLKISKEKLEEEFRLN